MDIDMCSSKSNESQMKGAYLGGARGGVESEGAGARGDAAEGGNVAFDGDAAAGDEGGDHHHHGVEGALGQDRVK